jgi:hypothetical protein
MRKHRPTFILAVALLGLLAPLQGLAQTGPARVISSIDTKVLNVESVVAGRIAKAVSAENGAVDISIAVDEVLKGDPGQAQQRHQERGQNNRYSVSEFSRMSRNKTRVLVIGQVFVPLDKSLAIPTARRLLLRDPDEVIEYVREVVRTHPGMNRTDSFNAPLPVEFQNVEFSNSFAAGSLGPPRDLIVPIDAQLEKWAVQAIRSGRDYPRSFQALEFFKSEANIALLQSLLGDPTFNSDSPAFNNGIETRVYTVREAAYETLKKWGVAVEAPVLREQIPRYETLESFNWQASTTEDVLRKLVEFSRNLRQFNVFDFSRLSERQMALIADIGSITSLSLNGLDKTDAMLSHVSKLRNLEQLNVRVSRITDKGLGSLVSLPRLRSLDLTQTRVTDDGLRLLAGSRSLRTVHVALTQVTQKGIAEVRADRPDLEIIWERSFKEREATVHEMAQRGDLSGVRKAIRPEQFEPADFRVNLTDFARNTPLIYAVAQNRYDVVKLLLDKGAKVDFQDVGKATPLLWATRHGYIRVMTLLLDRGANVNHRDEDGNTALHFATRRGAVESVRLLLARGANVLSKNSVGDTPLDIAARVGNPQILALVKVHHDDSLPVKTPSN